MKTQLKKSLSLFLAVLMVLSCWVWVAPQKAEAADSNYTVEVGVNVTDRTKDSGAYLRAKVWYITNNGTGTYTTGSTYKYADDTRIRVQTSEEAGLDRYYWTVSVPGFPYFVEISLDGENSGTNHDACKWTWDYMKINGYQTLTGGNKFTDKDNTDVAFLWTGATQAKPESGSGGEGSFEAPAPAIAGFEGASGSAVNLTLKEIGGEAVSGKSTFSYGTYFDQYGVKWTASTNTFHSDYSLGTPYISKQNGGDEITGDEADDIYYDASKGVVANANLQVSATEANDGKYEAHLVQKCTCTNLNGGTYTSTVSAPITVTYPKYTVKVNGAGSITGLDYTLGLSDGTTTNAEWKQEGYYGASLVNMPDGTGNAGDAYTFKGLWTEEQPTTGNASYNALEADFAEPISSEKFAEYDADGGTANGKFITYKEKLYYNAGTQWSTANKTISASADYYGWWLSKDLNIKFYDIDGRFLGAKAVKYGQNQSAIEWPKPTESYVSGAYTYNDFTGKWVDTNGDEVLQSAHTFTKDLILTPKYDTVAFDKTYTVIFINEANGENLDGSADYAYRTDLSNPKVIPADRTVPSTIRNDIQYSYTFEGWSTQTPSSGNYHILLEDGDFNEAGAAIAINNEWIVRSDVTYYPVYRRHLRTYAVNFWFKDSTGTEISRRVTLKYGETLSAPIDYVPYTYAREGYGYEFKNWTYTNASGAAATFDYNKTLVFTKENLEIGLGAVEDGVDVTPVAIRAAYGEPKPTPYNVKFNYKNDKGEDLSQTAEVNHGTLITGDIVNALKPADEYDDGEAMVHFTNTWKFVEGAGKKDGAVVAEGSEFSAEELLTFSPTSHVTFEAVYGNPEPFYTVTYIDGAAKFEERVLVGSNLPVWTNKVTNDNGTPDDDSDDFEEDVDYLPTKAATAQGSYEFLGWYDEQQTDTTYAVTNGNKYEATSTVTGNLTLYPQFKFSPYTYIIKFMSYDGKTQLAAGKYEYGQSIEMVTAEANRAAQAREQDDTYTYSFIGWDKTVPTFCEGVDMVFIAQYKPVYRYYNVKWYNSVLNGENWVADKSTKIEDGKTVETGLLATTKHTYNSKLNSPSVKAICTVTPPAGQSYAFTGWYYNDAEGNAQPYVRGMAITGEMEFYATYKLTNKLFTVTTVVDGETTEYEVAANDKAKISDPNAGYVDAEKHKKFDGWVTKDENGTETEFDLANTEITADITIYAKFTESAHDFSNEELVKAPTYYAKGEKKTWCSCDAKQTETTEEIAMLTDDVKPTGTIYLGTQGSWSSTGTPAYETDNQPVSLFANADTDVIITANDTGTVDALYNASGIGKGIANIKAFAFPGETALTGENYGAALQVAVTVFEDDTETLNNTANFVVKLGDVKVADLKEDGSVQYNDDGTVKFKDLDEGETYILYYYVTDKAGNRLDRLVRTAKFIYDNTAPVFTVEGDNNAEKVAGTPTYCKKATVTGIETGATLTVNGEAVTLTTTSAAGTGTYTITEAGNYFVTVTDKAGNKTSKKFQVNADHSYDVKEVLSTCTEDGYKTEICIVCGDEKDKVTYKAPGHVTTPVIYDATCLENGYVLIECSECDYSVKSEFEVDENGAFVLDGEGEKIPLFPALGHDYDMADGEIVYTVVTEATCKTKGKEIATCKACGETITREIAIDEDAHNWGATKTLKATCTEAGKTYHTCKLCYTSEDLTTISATGHVETQWIETKAPTCGKTGVETLQCKKCKAYVDGDDEDTEIDTREIPATGRHILAVSEDPTKTYEATADKEGQITRYCTECYQEWTEKVDKIKKYTVKFVDENDKELAKIEGVVSGTTITKDYKWTVEEGDANVEKTIPTPTKANSTDGKYAYKFAGWKDANGNAVTLPIDVTADITLKASYAQSTIIYTHTFDVPCTWVAPLAGEEATGYITFATMMGAMGDSRVPVAEPSFSLEDPDDDAALKKLYSFEFLGWSTTGAKGDIVTDFTIAGDATFYAVFEPEAVAYQVIYYNGLDYVWDTTVDGGETVTFGGVEPTKAPDSEYHYEFAKWYADATLQTEFDEDTAITSLTRLYAGFTKTKHTYDKSEGKGTVVKAATCTQAEKRAFECTDENCKYTIEEFVGERLGHNLDTSKEVTINGVTGYKCMREGCTYIESTETETHTVIFVNDNGKRLGTYTVNDGEVINFNGEVLDTTKESTAEFSYTFDKWISDDVEYTDEAVRALKIDKDYTFEASYTSTTRKYRVTYVDVNNNIIQTTPDVPYGTPIPAYTGTTKPTKAKDANFHYEFNDKWTKEAGVDTVTGDIHIAPVFDKIKHVYDIEIPTDPTCTTIGGITKMCECGEVSAVTEAVPALGHTDDINGDGIKAEHIIVNPTIYDAGSDTYVCERCGDSVSKPIKILPSQEIVITVNDKHGQPAANGVATVTITNKATGIAEPSKTTDENGQAIFLVAAGQEWIVGVENTPGHNELPDGGYGGTVGADGKFEAGEKADSDASKCSCTCHKKTFWAIIFRLFQKIIKIFTGKIGCCSDPEGY